MTSKSNSLAADIDRVRRKKKRRLECHCSLQGLQEKLLVPAEEEKVLSGFFGRFNIAGQTPSHLISYEYLSLIHPRKNAFLPQIGDAKKSPPSIGIRPMLHPTSVA